MPEANSSPETATLPSDDRDHRHAQVVRLVPRAERHQPHGQPGERIVVCGPSGSGKSTMIRCINHLEEHQRGKIMVEGHGIDR